MKVLKKADQNFDPATGDLYLGDQIAFAQMSGQPETGQVEVYMVSFKPGERNRVHIHEVDQILIGFSGTGIVADVDGEQIMEPGDTVTIPAGHPHWHGATADSAFSHITVSLPGDEITIVDGNDRGSWGAVE